MAFRGVIIEESLEDRAVLNDVKILRTSVEKVTDRHKTPWVKKWTLHTVQVPAEHAEEIARRLAKSLDGKHSWYADFKDEDFHYIIFKDRVFKVDRRSKEQYDEVNRYGEAPGIPSYQLDFSPHIK